MKDALLGFLRAARHAGVEVPPAESIDAFRAVELTGFDDRDAVRGALALVLGKTRDDEERVELVFDRYFGGDGAAFELEFAPIDDPATRLEFDLAAFEADLADSTLAQTLLGDDRARLVRDLYAAGRAERLQDVQYFTQINATARRILERLGLAELDAAIAKLRAFGFSGRALDITELLASESIEELGAHVMREIGFQSSDYGRAFTEIDDLGVFDAVDRKTTVVVLGDGRTNYGEPRIDLIQKLHDRAKRVVWLNPEDRGSWGTDDSEMLRYARYTHVAQTCNRLRHLERFVEDLLAESPANTSKPPA